MTVRIVFRVHLVGSLAFACFVWFWFYCLWGCVASGFLCFWVLLCCFWIVVCFGD